MKRCLRSGEGWRLGYDPAAKDYPALLGGQDWAIELTAAEWQDFQRLLAQLQATIAAIVAELMDQEAITLEAESDRLWLEIEGYPQAYGIRLMLQSGRQAEVGWPSAVVPQVLAGLAMLQTGLVGDDEHEVLQF
jgi:hypothetical protein